MAEHKVRRSVKDDLTEAIRMLNRLEGRLASAHRRLDGVIVELLFPSGARSLGFDRSLEGAIYNAIANGIAIAGKAG